jgi:hypothetical protein
MSEPVKIVLYNLEKHTLDGEYLVPRVLPVIRMPKPIELSFTHVLSTFDMDDYNIQRYLEYRLVGQFPDGRYLYVLDMPCSPTINTV